VEAGSVEIDSCAHRGNRLHATRPALGPADVPSPSIGNSARTFSIIRRVRYAPVNSRELIRWQRLAESRARSVLTSSIVLALCAGGAIAAWTFEDGTLRDIKEQTFRAPTRERA
jgi:hypothetical protein